LIKSLTNTKGDENFDDYLNNLKQASDEVIIIKLADIKTNTQSSIKNYQILKKEWFISFWIPLLKDYLEIFKETTSNKYPLTVKNLIKDIKADFNKIIEITDNN